MALKIIFWTVFLILTATCISWLGVLVIRTTADKNMRRGVAEARSERALQAAGPILLGVAGDWDDESEKPILHGIKMAVQEINIAGGVLGRNIEIIVKNDGGSVAQGRRVAEELAENLDVVAVIGHPTSRVSIPVSVIYEYYGLVMLSPQATSAKLTRQGYRHVFRNVPSDESIGEQMACFARDRGYKKIAIYYLQGEYGRSLANAFEKKAQDLSLNVVDRLSYDNTYNKVDFQRDIEIWKQNFSFDALFLVGMVPQGLTFIQQVREMGIEVPILCGDSMDTDQLLISGDSAADGTIVASTFNPDDPRPEVQCFNEDYRDRYDILPDSTAAQGYDAAKLLVFAMAQAGTTEPERVSEAFRAVKGWQGVTGAHSFATNGDLINKAITQKIVRNGQFVGLVDGQKFGHQRQQ